MKLTLNLATRLHYDRNAVRNFLSGFLVVAAALLIVGSVQVFKQQQAIQAVRRDIAVLNEKIAGLPSGTSEKEYVSQKQRISALNSILEQRNKSWLPLLDTLESAMPEGISLTNINPDSKGDQMKIEGMAKGFSVIRLFLEQLEKSSVFRDVTLVSHSEAVFADKSRGLQFALTLRIIKQ